MVPEAVSQLQNDGADVGESPADIASKTKTIITMLPSRFVTHAVTSVTTNGKPYFYINILLH